MDDAHHPILTKAKILQGTKHTALVHVEELGGKVRVRALSSGEVAEIDASMFKGQRLDAKSLMSQAGNDTSAAALSDIDFSDMEIDFDMEQLIMAQQRADALTAAYGLSCEGEEWSVAEVNTLPSPALDKIVAKVNEISNTEENDLSFRSKRGGRADGSAAGDGGAAGEDTARAHAGADGDPHGSDSEVERAS